MDAKYSEFFGFSELELLDLFNSNNINIDMGQLKHWYNGYQSGELENLYNPFNCS